MSNINVYDKVHDAEPIIGGGLSLNGDGGLVVVLDHDNREDDPYSDGHVAFNSSSYRPAIRNDDDDDDNNCPSHHHNADSQEQQHQHHNSSNNAQTVSFQIGPQHFDLIKLIGEGK
jgi:hypothetical protein